MNEIYILWNENTDRAETVTIYSTSETLEEAIANYMSENDTQEVYYICVSDMKKAGVNVVLQDS